LTKVESVKSNAEADLPILCAGLQACAAKSKTTILV